jgi:Spondin_N
VALNLPLIFSMKSILLFSSLSLVFVSCNKDNDEASSFSEARYAITVTGKWTSPDFTVPPGAHYTTFIGMVHGNNSFLWKQGLLASPGTEALAESGAGAPILAEIDSMIAAKNALSLILFVAPTVSGNSNVNIYCNSNFSRVSFASMLAPTPDWFVGVSGFDLYYNNKWIADTTINLYPLDAGTEDGDVFAYDNPSTVPQQNVHTLQASQAMVLANGNPGLAPIATVRFVRQ